MADDQNIQSEQINTSMEQLVPAGTGTGPTVEDAPPSPTCLRPINKIADVKTIKRQPKTGWL